MIQSEYKAIDAFHYSGLKMFAKCPRLYYETYITKTNVQEAKDYFLYGNVVDTLITQPEELNNRFVQVSRRSDGSTLDLEMKCTELRAEMDTVLIKAKEGNKVAIKGFESRQKKLIEMEEQIRVAKESGDKVQVPTAIWNDAHETATAIINLPLHNELLTQGYECRPQETLQSKGSVNRKGMIDRLYVKERDVIIVDIKTAYRLTDIDPLMYAGQLAYYKHIAEGNNFNVISCYALVGDKGDQKLAQDYIYSTEVLETAFNEVLKVETYLLEAISKNEWPSAKSIRGKEQECFSCAECSNRPFSMGDNAVTV